MRGIITLHSVDQHGSVISISPNQLDSLLDSIEKSGHKIVALSELLRHPGIPDRIAITFDDALASVAEEGLPLLARRGLVAAVFVVTGRVGGDNAWPGQPAAIPGMSTMGWGELEALAEAGWEIGSHSTTHANLTTLTDDQIDDEIGLAHATITERLGRAPEVFAYPYGASNPKVTRATGLHHRFGLGGRMALLDSAVDHPLDLPRIDGFYLRPFSVHRWFGQPVMASWLSLRRRARELRERKLTP